MKSKNLQIFFSIFFLIVSISSFGQKRTITGKVTDGDEMLYGVNVTIMGTTRGTITNSEGAYSIEASPGEVLTFSYIGYESKTIKVDAQSVINVELSSEVNTLNEAVVTAFGISKEKKSLGYSVTQIEGDKFTQSRATNLGNSLTGKIAGVNVSTPSTGAAGSSRVIIRGGSSLGGNDQPLYVINGVPMDNTNFGQAGMWGGNDNGDNLNSINPDDIATISVLKGNSASALYGARAANGVILITTKSGKGTNGLGVSFNSNYTFDKVNDHTNLQKAYGVGTDGKAPTTASQALDFGNSSWGAKLDGSSVIQFDGVSRPYSSTGQRLNNFYQGGHTWTNTMALMGSNQVGSFRFSASDLNNIDIMPNAGFDRTAFNTNINAKFGKLELLVSGQYSIEKAKNRPRLSDSPGNANFTVITKAPNISFSDLIGSAGKEGAKSDGTELRYQGNVYATNPYWAAYQFFRLDNKNRIFGNASLTYHLTDWLYVRGRMGTDYTAIRGETSEPYGTAYKPAGDYNINNGYISENNFDLFVGMQKQWGDFDVDALFGGNRMRRKYENSRIGGNGLNIPFFGSVNNVANQTYSYNFSEWGINSIFGQVNFGFRNFLFLNVTGRQDQFSTLSPQNNKVFYPSVSLGYSFTDGFKNLPTWWTYGKLRMAWAQVGGGAPDPYTNNLTYSLSGVTHNGATLGSISNGSIPNNALKPYISTEFEIGTDLRFIQNRIGLDFTYYNRKTKDDILGTTISGTSGYNSTIINVGSLTNKGVEIMLTLKPVKNERFEWITSVNYARNISNVISLGKNAKGEEIQFVNLDEARSRQERIRHYVGQQLGVIAGYKQQVINGLKVYDADGYPVRGAFEMIALGRHPNSAGWSNQFNFGNINFSFLLDMRHGGSMMSGTNWGLIGAGLQNITLEGRETGLTINGANAKGEATTFNIKPENVDNYYSRYAQITENVVYNASFGKLREISFGYSLPKKFLQKTPINSVGISIVGRNLALLWSHVPNVDPESAYSSSGNAQGLEYFAMPTTRNFGFNLNVTF